MAKIPYQIHPDCKPIPGRERIARIRDDLLTQNPADPYGGLHWLAAYGPFLTCQCGVCGQLFKEYESVTVLGVEETEAQKEANRKLVDILRREGSGEITLEQALRESRALGDQKGDGHA